MQIVVTLSEADADAERLQQVSEGVRLELLELEVDDVRPVRNGPPPPGSRGIDVAAVGAFLVTLGSSAEAINQVVTVLRSWISLGRATPRTVEVTVGEKTLRLSDATLAQQDRIVDAFLKEVRGSAG